MSSERISIFLQRWTAFVAGHPWRTLTALTLATVLIGYHAVHSFSIDSDTAELIRQDAQWRDEYDAFKADFPHLFKTSFVVISGTDRSRVEDTTRKLAGSLTDDARFESVFSPSTLDFFQDHGLLYMAPDELDRFLSQLAEMQPFLTRLAEDPTLPGLFSTLEEGLARADDQPLPAGFTEFAGLIGETAGSVIDGRPQPADWRGHLQPGTSGNHYSLIAVKGRQDTTEAQPNRSVVKALEQHVERARPLPSGVQVRLTGRIPLDYQEMKEATEGAKLAGIVSLVLLGIVLTLGVRSVMVVIAIYLSILVGLLWTTSFAGLTVGAFSTISVVFLVMFIGLGVDFAIHYCLRYQETLAAGSTQLAALRQAAGRTGRPISLCAVSSALGFLAFTPTDYTGLGELGIISAGGMGIAWFLSFTLIPAVLAAGPAPRTSVTGGEGYAATLEILSRHRLALVALVLTATMGAFWLSLKMPFNFSTLALRNPDSQAMTTLRELHDEDIMTSFGISIVAPDEETARAYAQRLTALETVSEVRLPRDHLPGDQQEKLGMLDDASFFLHPLMEARYQHRDATTAERAAATTSLTDTLQQLLDNPPQTLDREQRTALNNLLARLNTLQADTESKELLAQLETLLVGDMERELAILQRGLTAEAISFADLPQPMRERLVSASNKHHVMVLPSRDITKLANLRNFVEQVRDKVDNATGRPVIEYEVGEVVVEAFLEAVGYAVLAIGLLLLFSLRTVLDTVLVFTPLVLALIWTFAVAVLIDEPLNMANIIVLPLVFGLGVDNGIHVIRRFREESGLGSMLRSSTPRAVLLSALTTLGTFGALTLSPHQGMHSIGLLLTLAIGFQLFFTLLFLPPLLALLTPGPTRARASADNRVP